MPALLSLLLAQTECLYSGITRRHLIPPVTQLAVPLPTTLYSETTSTTLFIALAKVSGFNQSMQAQQPAGTRAV